MTVDTSIHRCIPCARCDSTRGCPEGDGRLCECGLPLCDECPCPDGCVSEVPC